VPQARLERIWNLLLTPLTARLDMVLEYTRKERVSQLEKALEVRSHDPLPLLPLSHPRSLRWEKAAVTNFSSSFSLPHCHLAAFS
jgi:hypothetical protein